MPRFVTPSFFALLCLFASIRPATAQEMDLGFLLTRAERSDWLETTTYDEVVGFLEVAARNASNLHLTHFGYTTEGRALPLIVYGNVANPSAASVRASGKTRVYLQGNIHGGEVCGKEALLMLVRELASGRHAHLADSLVLLIAPIYNADGNERVRLDNRPRQNGPTGGMGQRPNAEGLDLNRDHMKTVSPEAHSVIALMRDYDPHVSVDLHTTNGSRHAYHLTYAPPLNPNTEPALDTLLRTEWLPHLTERMKSDRGWNTYYYGNLPFRSGSEGWYTFDHRPRFNNNYIGLRNRLAILSEAYAYDTFRNRVLSTKDFVEEILTLTYAEAKRVRALTAEWDGLNLVGSQLAVRSEIARNAASVDISMGEVRTTSHPYTGDVVLERLDVEIPTPMPEYGIFTPTETSRVPLAWVVPLTDNASVTRIRQSLDLHGIVYSTRDGAGIQAQSFEVASLDRAERPFQGVQEVEVKGAWMPAPSSALKGTTVLYIPSAQPLGRLAHYLLDPRSDDGLANWAVLDELLKEGQGYPILRTVE